MQNTTHYNLKKPDYTDFADIQDINDNMDTIDEEMAAPTGDGRDQTVSFTDADLDSGITSFPTFLTKIVSGMKMAKFLRDLKAGMAYVLHVGSLVNNATCTESGKALDARMGKTLQDQITSLNDSLTNRHYDYANRTILRSGSMNIGSETYTITKCGYVFALNIYTPVLGTTNADNNYYLTMSVNNTIIGDSQSYVKLERGGSISAPVVAGDKIKLQLMNHAVDSVMLMFVELVE